MACFKVFIEIKDYSIYYYFRMPTPGVIVQGGAPNSMLEGGTKNIIKDMHLLSLKESQELLYDPFTFVLLAQT